MNKRKKIILFSLFLLFDLFLVGLLFYFYNQASLNVLKKEINELALLDPSKDRYNRPLKSKGRYRVVEKAIKEYFDSYAVELQDLSKVAQTEELSSLLTFDNYQNDGPNFDQSINFLIRFQDDYSKRVDSLLNKLEEDNIKKNIDSYTNNSYCKHLYNELLFQDDVFDDLLSTKELLLNSKNSMNQFYQVHIDLFNFLKNNQEQWILEDGNIKFANNDLFNQYNGYLSQLKK
ncbi:MAG: hypothetical protein IJG68_00515 [Bacilli bacterium]|nr:hypothetical protein [Bacilli bacterium]